MVACQVFTGKRDTIVSVNVNNPNGNEPKTEDVLKKMKKGDERQRAFYNY